MNPFMKQNLWRTPRHLLEDFSIVNLTRRANSQALWITSMDEKLTWFSH